MTSAYRRIHFLVEGTTEETIVRDVLAPHFEDRGWHATFSIVITRRALTGPANKGGVGNWAMLRQELANLLLDSSITVLTTVVDYYGFPADAPGMSTRPNGAALKRVAHVEDSLLVAIGDDRFVPHLVLHETESWVFAAPKQLAELAGKPAVGEYLYREAARAGGPELGPELVNDGPSTAPSKRIQAQWPSYSKTSDGPLAIADLGLTALRGQCPHLDRWLRRLEQR